MTLSMNLRRTAAVAALAFATAPVLASCGFDYATDRPNTIANGGYELEGHIHVLAARIVAPSDGTGSFVATITTDSDVDEPVELTDISGEGLTVDLPTVEIPGNRGMVNLADTTKKPGPIPVTGDFKAGESIPVTLTFSDDTTIKVEAIVVTQCHDYESIAPSAAASSASPSSEPSESASASESGADYDCAYPHKPLETEGGPGETSTEGAEGGTSETH